MTVEEKQEILVSLEQGRRALLEALDGVTAEQAVRVPAPGKWSILGCVEHLAISEDYLFAQMAKSTPSGTPVLNPQREARIVEHGADRTRRIEAPEQGRPKGRFPTLPDAVQHFLTSRERTVQFVEANQEDLRSKLTAHPLIATVNCHEMLLMMAAHPLRHAKQIEEIKSELA